MELRFTNNPPPIEQLRQENAIVVHYGSLWEVAEVVVEQKYMNLALELGIGEMYINPVAFKEKLKVVYYELLVALQGGVPVLERPAPPTQPVARQLLFPFAQNVFCLK